MIKGPIIKEISERKLVGLSMEFSFSKDLTYELWSSFMPRKKEIHYTIS